MNIGQTGNSASNWGAAGGGFAHGWLQGMILRRQMEHEDEATKIKNRAAQQEMALNEQKMRTAILQSYLDMQKNQREEDRAGREGLESEFKRTQLWPSQIEKEQAGTAESKAKTKIAQDKAGPELDAIRALKILRQAQTAKAQAETSKKQEEPGWNQKQTVLQANRKALVDYKAEKTKELTDIKDVNQRGQMLLKTLEDLDFNFINPGEELDEDTYEQLIEAKKDLIEQAGFDYEVTPDTSGAGITVKPVKKGAGTSNFISKKKIDSLPEGTERHNPDGTIDVMKGGTWRRAKTM